MTLTNVLKNLWKFRATNAVVVATLAATVGAMLSVLAIAENFFVRPWTYDTDRLGVLQHIAAGAEQRRYGFAAAEYRLVRDADIFEVATASRSMASTIVGKDGLPRRVLWVRTMPQALAVTDAAPLLGRFVEAADIGGGSTGIVISHDLWQSEFGGARDVLGRSIALGGITAPVVGVMPDRFHFLGGDVWTGLDTSIDTATSTDRRYVVNFKLRRAGELDRLLPQLATIAQRAAAQGHSDMYPPGWTIVGSLVIDAVMGPMRPVVFLIVGATLLMLLIAVVNIVSLLMSQHLAAEREATLRVALGAPWRHLAAQAFARNLALALVGAAAGWGVGALIFGTLVRLIAFDWVPRELEGHFTYSAAALWWSPVLALVIAAVLTTAQLLRYRKLDPGAIVRGGVREGGGRGAKVVRWLLVGTQVAAAGFVTLMAVGVGSSAYALRHQNPGFDATGVLQARVMLARDRYPNTESRAAAFDRLFETLNRNSNIQAAGAIDFAPYQRSFRTANVFVDAAAGDAPIPVNYTAWHGDVAAVLAPTLRDGRLLGREDRGDTQPVVLINRALQAILARSGRALGDTIALREQDGTTSTRTIVGVIDDLPHDSPIAAPRPTVVVPYAQDATVDGAGPEALDVLLRVRPGTTVEAGAVLGAIAAVDPTIPPPAIARLVDRGQQTLAGLVLAERLFAMFAAIAVVLAFLGCHVMLRLALQLRRRELAIRSALGASPARLFGAVIAEGAIVTGVGAAAGLALAAPGLRWINAALQGTTGLSVEHAASVVAGLLAAGVLASLWPARLAAQTQPLQALRST